MPVSFRMARRIRKGFKRRLYGGKFETVVRQTGIHFVLSLCFQTWVSALTIIGSYLPDTTHVATIEDTTAQFRVTSPRERKFIFLIGTGRGEDPVREFILQHIRPDDTFYDIGSNIGQFSCFVGQRVPKGSVVCFEPHPYSAQRLKENMELNNIPNYEILNIAVSNESDLIHFDLGDTDFGGMGYITGQENEKTVTVQSSHLDDVIDEFDLPEPNVIKMDVRGEEWDILQGRCSSLSRDTCRLLICEVHSRFINEKGGSVDEFESNLQELGFTYSSEIHGGRVAFSKTPFDHS